MEENTTKYTKSYIKNTKKNIVVLYSNGNMKKYAIIITNLFNIIMSLNKCRFEMFGGLNILRYYFRDCARRPPLYTASQVSRDASDHVAFFVAGSYVPRIRGVAEGFTIPCWKACITVPFKITGIPSMISTP